MCTLYWTGWPSSQPTVTHTWILRTFRHFQGELSENLIFWVFLGLEKIKLVCKLLLISSDSLSDEDLP